MNAISPQITFRHMLPSDAVLSRIIDRVAQLTKLHPRIMSCRIDVHAPDRHHSRRRLFNIRIDLKVPRRDIVVNRNPTPRQEHKDIYVAIRDAFDALERRLKDTTRRRRGDIKAHSKGEPRKPPS